MTEDEDICKINSSEKESSLIEIELQRLDHLKYRLNTFCDDLDGNETEGEDCFNINKCPSES